MSKTESMIEVPLTGVGFRDPFAEWILRNPLALDCVEITAEHFFDGGEEILSKLRQSYPVSVHGLGLSLGTPGPLDAETLASFRHVAELVDARWISEHIAFTRTDDVDLGHLNPVPQNVGSLRVLIDHAREVMDYCGRPLLLENITSNLKFEAELEETDFINRLCEKSQAALLLDVTNLFINSRNHRFDPVEWLNRIERRFIKQVHIVGYSYHDGKYRDRHCEPIQDELFDLLGEAVAYAPIESIIVERDGEFPEMGLLESELERLEKVCETARCR